ncbi:MAG: hypothetical protein HYT41_00805 [Candidatus Sungbacteria bacterium]|nr:hypothetical protein [Candidatus Sungbacteria bacterium]
MKRRHQFLAAMICIVAAAFVLRLAGVSYGLPLRLIADEPQYILTGVLMVQEHMITMPLHLPAFSELLYSPPHLIYLFLVPFGSSDTSHRRTR